MDHKSEHGTAVSRKVANFRAHDDELVMTLVELALQRSEPDREPYLKSACADDTELFAEVWHYVQSEHRMNGFLLDPLVRPLEVEAEYSFRTGELLEGRFRIVREVAQGGMGIVYEAWDQRLDKRVALKCAKSGFRKRLPPEVRSATEIAHPNVCKTFEIHTANHEGAEIDFLTMEFLEGQTLAQRLQEGPLPQPEARAIAIQLCEGLAEAHRKGVIHGDLKANNIILTKEEGGTVRAVITDFGLARGASSMHPAMRSDAGGTPDYMAPELWNGEKLSVASDIYALGVVLYELACGHRPFGADVSTEARTVRQPPPAHPKWDRVLARCLAPDPRRRLIRVEDVIHALQPPNRYQFFVGAAAALLVTAVLGIGSLINSKSPEETALSVAVLPFVSEGMPTGSEYLSDGITESLIHTLARFPELKVIARSSSSQFKGRGTDLQDVARRLNANFLVTGRIREEAGRLEVTAELVNGTKGIQLWGAQYSPAGADLAGLEERLATQIAEQIGAKLTNTTQARLSRSISAKPQAYELLLRGQYQIRLYTVESRQKAIGYFEQALVVDPEFALANAELANVYRLLGGGGILDPAETMPKAEAAARRALSADPDLAEAHSALADIAKDQWNWATAEREYRRAIDLNKNLTDAHMGYAILLSVMGRYGAALEEVQKMRGLDPVGLPAALHAAAVHYNAHHYADALKELARARDLDPSAPTPWSWMGMVYGGSGRYSEAVDAYQHAVARGDDTAATQCFYVYSLTKSGQRDQAQKILNRLLKTNQFVPLTALAVAYAGLDQKEKAIQLLQKAYTTPDPILQYLKVESHFDGLKDRPEYTDLAAKIGLP
jgi:serine/threonine protein kinase/tetratricopeptide (TPR) repeat protein